MSSKHEQLRNQLVEAVFGGEGDTDRMLRRSVKMAASAGRKPLEIVDCEVPAALKRYIEKVSHEAYRITDADVRKLKDLGYSEDAIFELTISAAIGAGFGRLERGMAAMGDSRLLRVGTGNEVK